MYARTSTQEIRKTTTSWKSGLGIWCVHACVCAHVCARAFVCGLKAS